MADRFTLAERDALDIIEKKIYEARVERNEAKWNNNWRPIFNKLESIRNYLTTHRRWQGMRRNESY